MEELDQRYVLMPAQVSQGETLVEIGSCNLSVYEQTDRFVKPTVCATLQ